MKVAIFPGSFDPFTVGHASIVERGLPMFDRIVIGVGVNDKNARSMTPNSVWRPYAACMPMSRASRWWLTTT